MISKILYNQYCKKAIIIDVTLGSNKEFFIWRFKDAEGNNFVGFTPSKAYFGSRTHQWYSIVAGYYLPHGYSIDFQNLKGKECYICIDQKKVVRSILPTNKQELDNELTPAIHPEQIKVQPEEMTPEVNEPKGDINATPKSTSLFD